MFLNLTWTPTHIQTVTASKVILQSLNSCPSSLPLQKMGFCRFFIPAHVSVNLWTVITASLFHNFLLRWIKSEWNPVHFCLLSRPVHVLGGAAILFCILHLISTKSHWGKKHSAGEPLQETAYCTRPSPKPRAQFAHLGPSVFLCTFYSTILHIIKIVSFSLPHAVAGSSAA